MATLRSYLNAKIKEKNSTLAKEKAKAGKYKSIAAAKKAGALYYTNKDGKVMAAVYAEDLKKPLTKSTRPKKRPDAMEGYRKGDITTRTLSPKSTGGGRGDGMSETVKRKIDPKSPSALKGQSAKFNTFFKNNKSKYKKEGGGFNMKQAQKDFAKTQKK
jgi:hypothetical protein